MDAVVIPWFLVLTSFAAINNTEIRNEHGPVYVYDVAIDFSRSPEKNVNADYSLNLLSTLTCRARNASVLFCTLGERRMTISDYKHHARFQRIQTAKESFEIYYNEAGVQSLRVSSSSSSSFSSGVASDKRYGLVKIIASQLNFGTDFSKHKSFAFTTNETSSFGECETVFTVLTSSCPENTTREDLRMRSIFYESLGDSVLLRKRRNTRNCDRPNEVSLIENNDSIVPTVTSSYSEMRVCSGSFESSTIVEGKTVTINKEAQASVFRQVVKIRLENIESAKEDLPAFDADTATDTIYLHKDIDNNEFDT